ncbi:MAG: Rne/Rng family ribonuclease [Pelagimonas sp.]|nr:Rne/Rng family ribonuclease [Pelagimonas sp.]
MAKKMLIDATHSEETRVVVVDGNKVEEFDFESENKRQLAGNIYLAKVTRVEPSLQAAFVDYGGNRHGFLAFSEIHPDYYQIPMADRQALMEEEAAYAAAAEEEDEAPKKPRSTRTRTRKSRAKAAADAPADTTDAPTDEVVEGTATDVTEDTQTSSREISGMETIDLSDSDGDGDDTEAGDAGEGLSPMETVAETPVVEPEDETDVAQASLEEAPEETAKAAAVEAPADQPSEAPAQEDQQEVQTADADAPTTAEDDAEAAVGTEDKPQRPMAASSDDDAHIVSADPSEVTSDEAPQAGTETAEPTPAAEQAAPETPASEAQAASEPTATAEAAEPAQADDTTAPSQQAQAPAETVPSTAEQTADTAAQDAVAEGDADPAAPETATTADKDGKADKDSKKEGKKRSSRSRSRKKSSAAERDETIESVADDDTEEDIRPVRKPRPRRYKIQEVIKVRQIMLVQVVKEERGNKGAALTTYLSLAGRYCVLMPNTARGGGISRKITNASDRSKLKAIAGEIDVPKGAGLIIRTAGAKRTKTEIKRDYEYLQRLWEQIRELTLKSIAPAKIYEEGDLIKRSIRDLYNREIDEVLVEGDNGYRIAKDFMKMIMPSHAKNVKHYTEQMPLFARFQVESYLGGMFNPTVQLKSGGYIVIGVTEALVAIDVNSGRATKEGSIEETALKTNLEAAEEVARQLRLRDLAGLIVIDFIDMDERKNNTAVEKRLKDKLKTDRARIQVGRISGFGLLEMSRQRLRPGMIEATTQPCPHCHGTGLIRSDDSMALQVLRQIEEEGTRRRTREVLVKCPVEIANYLMNQKREHIAQIEARYGMSVRIEGDPSLVAPDFSIEKFKTATRNVTPVEAPVVSVDTKLMEQLDEEAAEADETEAETVTPQEDGEDKPKKKRRRRRRRGGKKDGDQPETSGDEGGEGTQTQTEPAETSEPETAEAAQSSQDDPVAPETEEDDKPKKKRSRSRSRSRKPKADTTEGADAAQGATPAEGTEAATAADAAPADAEPVTQETSDEASEEQAPAKAEAPQEVETPETPAQADSTAQEPVAQAEAPTDAPTPVAEAEEAPVKRARTRVKASDMIAQIMANAETASDAPESEASAPEAPEEAEVVAGDTTEAEPAAQEAAETAPEPAPEPAQDQPAAEEAPKPKKRGWWSLSR